MPKPIPPPPPQPSLEETGRALRFLASVVAVTIALFGLFTLGYDADSTAVRYGRKYGTTWLTAEAEKLREDPSFRVDGTGPVVWLVGSSILREAFSQKAVNAALEERGSLYRVRKFGINRGASGIAFGLLRELPVRPGDVVVHNVTLDNFRTDWVGFTRVPGWRLTFFMTRPEVWQIAEYSVGERLEEMSAFPRDLYRYHEEHARGVYRWMVAPLWGVPKAPRTSHHLSARRWERRPGARFSWLRPERQLMHQGAADIDFSPEQFNQQGLDRMRDWCAQNGLELLLLDIPPSRAMQRDLMDADARATWDRWRDEHDVVYAPQPRDDDYFDIMHPNYRGRALLSEWLTGWVGSWERGEPIALPEYGGLADEALPEPAEDWVAAMGVKAGEVVDEEPDEDLVAPRKEAIPLRRKLDTGN